LFIFFSVKNLYSQSHLNLKSINYDFESSQKKKSDKAHLKELEDKHHHLKKECIEIYEELRDLKKSLRFVFDSIKK